MTARPWTSGPWSFEWWQYPEKPLWNPKGRLKSGDKTIVEEGYYCEEDVFDWSDADAKLIALAPEMAEAILDLANWDCNCENPYSREHHSKMDCANLGDVAEKLRAIGGTHD